MVYIWLPVFMNTLPENYEHWYTGWKNDADSKYDSQIAVRAIPHYEPLNAGLASTIINLDTVSNR